MKTQLSIFRTVQDLPVKEIKNVLVFPKTPVTDMHEPTQSVDSKTKPGSHL